MLDKNRVLFVLKDFSQDDELPTYSVETHFHGQYGYFGGGLYWSAKYVSDMLNQSNVPAKLVEVFDNSFIDAEIVQFKPTIVIVEALWVVPAKLAELQKLHPEIVFIVLLHSETPFLASEGIAVDWIKQYAASGVRIAVNSPKTLQDASAILDAAHITAGVFYLPDYYKIQSKTAQSHGEDHLSVSSYGAIRPLKNQLIQAVAAIQFANQIGKKLFFHINGTRPEDGGNVILQNIRALFAGTDHTLVEDDWMTNDDFLKALQTVDIGMQVSLSETFSIVAADMTSVGIPIVVSPEVRWSAEISHADPTDSTSIVAALLRAHCDPQLNVGINRERLGRSVDEAKRIWLKLLGA